MAEPTIVTITEEVTDISVTNKVVEISLAPENTLIEVNNFAIPVNFLDAQNVVFSPYGTITADNVQTALEQVADQNFRSSTTPVGDNIEEGDTWYDTSTEQFYVYRETSPALFEWVPIMVGNDSPDSDTLDAGAF